jgi:hypothetical protein
VHFNIFPCTLRPIARREMHACLEG